MFKTYKYTTTEWSDFQIVNQIQPDRDALLYIKVELSIYLKNKHFKAKLREAFFVMSMVVSMTNLFTDTP